jgi:Ser/Thr protein kinase RdoA (MazF antagonist)
LIRRITNAAPEGAAGVAVDRVRALPAGDSVLHSDLHLYNVMGDGSGNWIAIDWDVALTGPRVYGVARSRFLLLEADIADVAAGPGGDDSRRIAAAQYVDAYNSLAPIDRDELDAWRLPDSLAPIDRDELDAWRLPVLAARLDESIIAERDYLLEEIAMELAKA